MSVKPPRPPPPPFLMLLFELIGSTLEKLDHAQRACEASADTHQSDRQPARPPNVAHYITGKATDNNNAD